jgi:hypothetical protein
MEKDHAVKSAEEPKKDTEDSLQKLNEVLKGNYVHFKLNSNRPNTETALNHLIYKDPALIQYYIPKRQNGTTVLTFLDVSLSIDGLAGLSCGEYFQIDGVPEVYNQNGYFQITNVKHGLNENQWKTSIEASYLLKSIDVDESKTNLNDGKPYIENKVPDKPKAPPSTPTPKEVPRATGSAYENLFYNPSPGVTEKVPLGYYKGIDGNIHRDVKIPLAGATGGW